MRLVPNRRCKLGLRKRRQHSNQPGPNFCLFACLLVCLFACLLVCSFACLLVRLCWLWLLSFVLELLSGNAVRISFDLLQVRFAYGF